MPEAVQPGDVLDGKYVVEKVLGSGGMGMVVAARHVDLGQRVAVKFMLREAMHDASNVDRFKREARAAVQLKSVHTARVIDVGQLRNGEPYMVMEYLEGQDLDDVLRNVGALAPHVAVDYMLQAAEAIAEAHALGMIHRDIKPKNLFLTRSVDGRPLVKVLDFGLAKNLGKEDVSLTATTAVFGSPQYMSPEQMRSAKDADTRSDIWSLGVCLYELMTGQLPFDAPGVAEICAMVLKDPVPPPTRIRPDLPMQLEAVVMTALEKDPRHRFQSVADFAIALEPFAFEGSGRRILAVMETASRPQIQTQIRMGPLPTSDEIVKTISSWDSGGAAAMTGSSGSRTLGALIGVALAGVILIAGGLAYLKWSQTRAVTAATSASTTGDTPPVLPTPPEPVATATAAPAITPQPTVIVAAPIADPEPNGTAKGATSGPKGPKHTPTTTKPTATAKATTVAPPPPPPAPTPASTQKKTWDTL